MKVLVALTVVALAAADSDSYWPGYGFPQHQAGVFPFAHHNMGYRMPYHAGFQHQQQLPFVPYQQHQRLFRRDADSDSKSFYPGFPFVPPTPYGYHQQPYYHHGHVAPYMHRPMHVPMPVQQYTTYSHPMMMNPLLKLQEEKYPEVKEHKLEKRESDSDSDSFYPGFPYMPPIASPYGYHQQPFHQQPYYAPQQTYGLPNVVPRVLPYNFPGYHYQSSIFKPVISEEKKE